MPTVELEDGALYYEIHGSGPPLLLVAGLGGLGSYWAPQIEAFSQHFTVILHDHRGTGKSARSHITYSLEQMARDTLHLMNALDIDSAHLVGHSTGASIGQILAIEEPDRMERIVMASGWTKADGFFSRCFEMRRELLLKSGVEAYARATPLFLYPSWWIRDNIATLEQAETAVYGSSPDIDIMNSRIGALLAFDVTERLDQIEKEVLVLGVRNDNLTPKYYSEDLARMIPGAKLAIMEDGGHAASQTMPAEFNALVLDFLLAEGAAA